MLRLSLVKEALHDLNRRAHQRVQGEDDIVEAHVHHAGRVPVEVLGLNFVNPEKSHVEYEVREEPNEVERQEVEAQADDTLPAPVVDDLREEGDVPSDRVDPAQDVAKDVESRVDDHCQPHEGVLCADEPRREGVHVHHSLSDGGGVEGDLPGRAIARGAHLERLQFLRQLLGLRSKGYVYTAHDLAAERKAEQRGISPYDLHVFL